MQSLTSQTSYTIVQIQATRFTKGQCIEFELLDDMVPGHKNWYELTDATDGLDQPDDHDTLFTLGDCVFLENAIGLLCSSVGDWADGYFSFFEQERDLVGLDELLEPYMEAIRKDVVEKFHKSSNTVLPTSISMTTLWKSDSWQDYEGEWDFSLEYLGAFQMKDIVKLMQTVS